jgi:transmembrane sensor
MTNLYSEEEALYALLCKYVLSEATDTERLWVEEWLKTDPGHPVLLASLSKMLAQVPKQATQVQVDTDRSWQRLVARMDESTPVVKMKPRRMSWAAAAAVIFLAGVGLWWMMTGNTLKGPLYTELNDGTSVQLDKGATLKIENDRTVKLSGKAVFHVTRNAAHPFRVRLGNQEVKVLGTQFTVDYNHYLKVHVDNGRVMVTDPKHGDSAVLSAGMLLQQQEGQSGFQVVSHVRNMEKKEIVFTDTPLKEVVQTIGLVYNKKITTDTALLQLHITTSFSGETIEDVLHAIAYMTNTTVIKHSTEIELKKNED